MSDQNRVLEYLIKVRDEASAIYDKVARKASEAEKKTVESYRRVQAASLAASRAQNDGADTTIAAVDKKIEATRAMMDSTRAEVAQAKASLRELKRIEEEKLEMWREAKANHEMFGLDETKKTLRSATIEAQGATLGRKDAESAIRNAPSVMGGYKTELAELEKNRKGLIGLERARNAAARAASSHGRQMDMAARQGLNAARVMVGQLSPGLSRVMYMWQSVAYAAKRAGISMLATAGPILAVAAPFIVLGAYMKAGVKKFQEYEKAATDLRKSVGSFANAKTVLDQLTSGRNARDAVFGLKAVSDAFNQLHKDSDGALGTADFVRLVGDAATGTKNKIEDMAAASGNLWKVLVRGGDMAGAVEKFRELGVLSDAAARKILDMKEAGASSTAIWAELETAFKKHSDAVEVVAGSIEHMRRQTADAAADLGREWGKTFEGAAMAWETLKAELAKGATAAIRFVFGKPKVAGPDNSEMDEVERAQSLENETDPEAWLKREQTMLDQLQKASAAEWKKRKAGKGDMTDEEYAMLVNNVTDQQGRVGKAKAALDNKLAREKPGRDKNAKTKAEYEYDQTMKNGTESEQRAAKQNAIAELQKKATAAGGVKTVDGEALQMEVRKATDALAEWEKGLRESKAKAQADYEATRKVDAKRHEELTASIAKAEALGEGRSTKETEQMYADKKELDALNKKLAEMGGASTEAWKRERAAKESMQMGRMTPEQREEARILQIKRELKDPATSREDKYKLIEEGEGIRRAQAERKKAAQITEDLQARELRKIDTPTFKSLSIGEMFDRSRGQGQDQDPQRKIAANSDKMTEYLKEIKDEMKGVSK